MNYKITFRDKSSTIISKEEGESLKEMMLNNTVPTNIEINGNLHRASEIISVVKGADPIDDLDLSDAKRLEVGKRCRGQYSIQWEISKEIKRRYGKQWPRHIGDKPLRETIRHELHTTGKSFCDYKNNICICDPLYFSRNSRTAEVLDVSSIFPNSYTQKFDGR